MNFIICSGGCGTSTDDDDAKTKLKVLKGVRGCYMIYSVCTASNNFIYIFPLLKIEDLCAFWYWYCTSSSGTPTLVSFCPLL